MTPYNDWIVAAIIALTPVFVTVLDWLLGKADSEIPSWVKPLLASGAGSLIAYLATLQSSDPILIAAIGLATIGLREIVNQFGQKVGLFRK